MQSLRSKERGAVVAGEERDTTLLLYHIQAAIVIFGDREKHTSYFAKSFEMKYFLLLLQVMVVVALAGLPTSFAFVAHCQTTTTPSSSSSVAYRPSMSSAALFAKITQERRRQLGINDDEDEYDLDFALENNTDPFISKLVAGSLIVVIIALLTVGVIIPLTTDFGEGVCNPALTGGRC